MSCEYIDEIMKVPEKEMKVWTILHYAGYNVYLVGGAVRDILLGKTPKDYDFATNATPDEVKKVFLAYEKVSHCHFNMDYVGETFGVMMVNGIEIATFRGDRYSDDSKGFHDVEITYLDTIEEDLARRDFTVNAMALDMNGTLIDPHGGESDARKGILRFVGDPEDRINEDPNRILRALRFAARFEFMLHLDTALAIKANYHRVDDVAPERIRLEILKTLESTKEASIFWKLLLDAGILARIFPEMVDGWEHDHGNHHEEDVWTHNMIAGDTISTENPLLKLAGYLHDVGKPASFDSELGTFYEHQHFGADIVRERLTDLKFSNEEIRYVVNLVLVHMDGTRGMSPKARRRLKNKLNAYGLDWKEYLELRIADRTGNVRRPNFTSEQIQEYVDMFTIVEEVPFSVNDLVISGGDVINLFNLKPSPIVGKIQRELLKLVIDDGDEKNNLSVLVDHAMEVFDLELNKDAYVKIFLGLTENK